MSVTGGILRFSVSCKRSVLPIISLRKLRFSSSLPQEKLIEAVPAADNDLVTSAVKDLLRERITSKVITDEHIQKSYENFQHRLKEAKLCIIDCEEFQSDGKILQEEAKQASEAIDEVFACYIDMLDAFRECSEQQKERFGSLREKTAMELKSLRKQLDAVSNNSP